jgi:hypothetical protein
MSRLLALLVLTLLVFDTQAEEYYRSLDGMGKVHYGDKPLEDAADIDKIKPLSEPSPADTLPYEIRRAADKFPVTLYVVDNCGTSCQKALDYLNKRSIPYTLNNLSSNEEIEAFKKASLGDRVPTMHIGKNWLKGFSQTVWDKELDIAGYPQQPPYGFHPVIKTAPSDKSKNE